jgi:hypothetical protein
VFAGPLAVFVPIACAADRDWSQNPAIVELDIPSKVLLYAIGDTHADYGRLVDLLVKGDIISVVSREPDQVGSVTWKAGNAVLVCTGDMIDKSVNSVEVLQLFMRLRNIAPDSGGKVIVTCGNHEAEFLANPTDSNMKAVEFLAELKRMQAAGVQNISAAEVGNGTDSLGLGQFLRSLPFAVRVNDWFFAHAGNTNSKNPNKATQPRSLPDLQNFLQSDVTANGYGAAALSDDKSILEAKLKSPWWQEKDEPGEASANRLRKYVTALGTSSHRINHLVIGHQPGDVKFNGDQPRTQGVMVSRYNGTILLIDCGMSSGVGYSTGALLRIRPIGFYEGYDGYDAYSIKFEGDVRKEEMLTETLEIAV